MMLRSYFSANNISIDLTQRIWDSLRHCKDGPQRRTHEKDVEILNQLPNTLQGELREQLFLPSLLEVPFFQRYFFFKWGGMRMLCHSAIEESFLHLGEDLFALGEVGENMYLLSDGEMTYKREGFVEEVVIRESGQWAAEAAIWLVWLHRGTFRARIPSEVLKVNAAKSRDIILEHSPSALFAARYAGLFLKFMRNSESWTDVLSGHDTATLADDACDHEMRDHVSHGSLP